MNTTFAANASVDLFHMPPGVTANAGTWLVNNRRVGEDASAVPEPAPWALVALGLC
jgi:hypothetical protein